MPAQLLLVGRISTAAAGCRTPLWVLLYLKESIPLLSDRISAEALPLPIVSAGVLCTICRGLVGEEAIAVAEAPRVGLGMLGRPVPAPFMGRLEARPSKLVTRSR
jgi:hypothetical protein